ncbi:MAG: OmpA family protein [Streptosporangiales bacterium]|nr:OmpA family protein [Streptosporangiales bacterium]MBO0889489.1 OmpA family protein [Acidothermales bacterium]
MRVLARSLASGVCLAALLVAAQPAAAAPPLPSPRIVDLKPRVVTLKPRIVDLRPKQRKRTFTVDADVLFAFDSAKLSPDATTVLDDVVRTLDHPGVTKATVTGYTDSIGSRAYNLSLSRRRAAAVRAYLQGKVTNSRLRCTATGKGEKDPVASNTKPGGSDDPVGRRKNRRVVISYD